MPQWVPEWVTGLDIVMAAGALACVLLVAGLWLRVAGAQLAAQTESYLAGQAGSR